MAIFGVKSLCVHSFLARLGGVGAFTCSRSGRVSYVVGESFGNNIVEWAGLVFFIIIIIIITTLMVLFLPKKKETSVILAA